ncbi:MAG: glycosyltransferase family 2 protein [Dehalococcoidia bacterium]|nr:glycosyltransferase family 2 protein [Dehalococcoidia bacterium]
MSLSVVLPAFNEERRIERALQALAGAAPELGITEVIVVDDGSADATAEVVARVAAHLDAPAIRLLRHPHNRGKGAALRTGLLEAAGDHVGFIDADLSVSPETFADAAREFAEGYDLVVGSREAPTDGARREGQPLLRRALGHMFVATQQRIVGLPFSDTQCPFKVLTREAAQAIVPECSVDGWAFDVEMLVVAQRQGWRVRELPVRWTHVEGSTLRSSPSTAWRTMRELLAIRREHRAF